MLRLARVTPATVQVLQELLSSDGATWGLRIVGATGRPAGSVYPILARLEDAGWVVSWWEDTVERGPRRRLYELTADGREGVQLLLREQSAAEKPARAARMSGRVAGAS